MSYIPSRNYTSFDTSIKPYSFFSLFIKPIHEPIVPPIKKNNGEELKAFWQPEASDNNKLLLNTSIKTNSDYRKYMTHKSDLIRDHNMRYISK
jgi:hypothetical protein